jgi:hypothetical protein
MSEAVTSGWLGVSEKPDPNGQSNLAGRVRAFVARMLDAYAERSTGIDALAGQNRFVAFAKEASCSSDRQLISSSSQNCTMSAN